MLSEQASEARETADRLRTALAKRDENSLSPDEVKALQREVWREQRRSAVRQDMSIHTQSLLTKICSPIAETPPPLAQPAPPITRAEANLQKFLQQSPTHRIFPPNRSPTQSAPLVRRKTISQVQPMQLRSTALELALRSPVDMHSRSLSLDSPDPRRSSASTDVTCVSEVASERTTVVPQLQLTIRRNLTVKGPPSPSPLSPGPGGIVSIEAQAPPRPRESLIAEVGQVPLPDYAVDLLEDLVASSLDVALSPLSPSPLVVRAPTYPYIEAQPRASSSLPDFLRFRATQPQEDQNMPSARPSSPPSRPPSLILDRLLNKPDIPSMSPSPPFSFSNASSSSWSPVPSPTPGNALSPPPAARRRPGASEAQQKRRSSAGSTQSLYVPSTSRFSSLRLSTPSLFAVPETDALGGSGAGPSDPLSRPQSSMSSYAPLDSPEAVLERRYGSTYAYPYGANDDGDRICAPGETDAEGYRDEEGEGHGNATTGSVRRRFTSFRRRRFNSDSSVRVGAPASGNPDGEGDPAQAQTSGSDGVGMFTRVRRRFSARAK